jgi:hypothetical protein
MYMYVAVVRDFFVFKSLKKLARKGTKSPPGREQKARPEGNKKPGFVFLHFQRCVQC